MKQTRVLLALGTNNGQEINLKKAKKIICELLTGCQFTPCLWTEPIDIVSDRFLNALAIGTTALSMEQLQAKLKQVERALGDNKGQHRDGVVNMDIDLLQYGRRRLKPEDWQKPYIQELIKILPYDKDI